MTDILISIFITSNIFPILVIISSFIGYGLYVSYKQMKIEIEEERLKSKVKTK